MFRLRNTLVATKGGSPLELPATDVTFESLYACVDGHVGVTSMLPFELPATNIAGEALQQ